MFLKKKKKKKIRIILPALFLILAAAYSWYYYSLNIPVSVGNEIKEFKIESGWGSTKISNELKEAGLIRSKIIFQFYTWRNKISGRLQDGEYNLSKSLNIKEISQILSRGIGASKEITLTFIEGWNNKDYANYLESMGISSEKDFFESVQKKADWWDSYDFLESRPRNSDLEGYLFPDTYRFYSDAPLSDIIKKLLDNFGRKLTPDLRQEIKNQGKTIHEVLTLASIIEKEISCEKKNHYQDCGLVADIFYKRLQIGMPLQADATVNYITGKGVTRSSLEDLRLDNPYNTYRHKGLPPGPICNPGLSAIKATIYPIKNDYWYFLTTPKGEVIYSRTHDEHVAAKNKYYR